jgi:hypothetical protein
MAEPPVDAANQLIVPVEVAAVKVTVPFPQRLAGVVEVMLGAVVIVAITAVREAETQDPFTASA